MRIEVQNRILLACQTGTFEEIEYGKTSKVASKRGTFQEPKIAVNEIASTPSQSIRHGARDGQMGLSNWRFEARLKFTSEVDTYAFMTTQLNPISFTHDNTRIKIKSVGVPVVHPPRQGSHNGTEMVITFSVNTRR